MNLVKKTRKGNYKGHSYLNNYGVKHEFGGAKRTISKAAQGLQFRRGDYRHMQAKSHTNLEQPFKVRGILDDEFLELDASLFIRIAHADAFKGNGVDSDTTEAKALGY
jgi:hypothetical protein